MRRFIVIQINRPDRNLPDPHPQMPRQDQHLQLELIAVRRDLQQRRNQTPRNRPQSALRILQRDAEENPHQETSRPVSDSASERNIPSGKGAGSENQAVRMLQSFPRKRENIRRTVLAVGIRPGTLLPVTVHIIQSEFQRRALPSVQSMGKHGAEILPFQFRKHMAGGLRRTSVVHHKNGEESMRRQLAHQHGKTFIRIVGRDQDRCLSKIHRIIFL